MLGSTVEGSENGNVENVENTENGNVIYFVSPKTYKLDHWSHQS